MSWMGKWNGHTAGNWYGAVVDAVVAWLSRGKAVLVEYKQAHVVQKLAEALVWMRRP